MRDVTGSTRVRGRRRNRRTGERARWASGIGQSLRGLLPWALGLAAFAGGAFFVHQAWRSLSSSSRLQIHAIELSGNSRLQPGELSAYTGISVGDPILATDLDAAALGLRRHPWVASAYIKRRLPDRIVVEVAEHTAEIIVCLGELYLANAEGKLFKRLSARDGLVLPVVTGIGREEAAARPDDTAALVRAAVELAHAIEREGKRLGRIEELHWDPDLGWSVASSRGTAVLWTHLGLEPEGRVATATAALLALGGRRQEPQVLWVDGIKSAQRVWVRLRPGSTHADETLFAKAR